MALNPSFRALEPVVVFSLARCLLLYSVPVSLVGDRDIFWSASVSESMEWMLSGVATDTGCKMENRKGNVSVGKIGPAALCLPWTVTYAVYHIQFAP
jgi:hypothetical protein